VNYSLCSWSVPCCEYLVKINKIAQCLRGKRYKQSSAFTAGERGESVPHVCECVYFECMLITKSVDFDMR
jgi:hypothetical protein